MNRLILASVSVLALGFASGAGAANQPIITQGGSGNSADVSQ